MLWWEKGLSYIIEGMWGGENLSDVTFMPLCEPHADSGSLAGTDKTYISSPSAASGTGQRDVPDTGLMDYRARMYSAQLGRFIQPDTIVPGAGNSQAWNRYSYVQNSPLAYSDPSGHLRIAEGSEYATNAYQIDLRKQYNSSNSIVTLPQQIEDIITDSVKFTPTPDILATLGIPTLSCQGIPCRPTATLIPTSTATPPAYLKPSIKTGDNNSDFGSIGDIAGDFARWLRYDFFGLFDPWEPGAFTGTNTNLVQSYVDSIEFIVLANPNTSLGKFGKATLPIVTMLPAAAVAYDYSYDQITNTGPYSNFPPRTINEPITLHQFVVVSVTVTLVTPMIVAFVK